MKAKVALSIPHRVVELFLISSCGRTLIGKTDVNKRTWACSINRLVNFFFLDELKAL